MVNEWFREWFDTNFYHQLYFNRNENEARQFIDKLLGYRMPEAGSRLLDVGCGRGRHVAYLASKGFDVTGIDLSQNSIRYAKKSEAETLHFYQHDMRLPFWMNYFDCAFNFFASFGYFATQREHDSAIRTIAQSVKAGGVFLLDYLNVHYAENHLVHNEIKRVNGTSYEIHRWHNAGHFFKQIIVRSESLEKPLEFTEKVMKFRLGDFTDMLAFQGMSVIDAFGNYQLVPYDVNQSPRLILAARKSR